MLVADLLGGELIERDPVAEAAALGVRRAGEEALLGRVPAGDARRLTPEKTVMLLAMRRELFEIRRERVIAARFLRERRTAAGCPCSSRIATMRRGTFRRRRWRAKAGLHGIEQRQGEVTPAPRRKVRRLSGLRHGECSWDWSAAFMDGHRRKSG